MTTFISILIGLGSGLFLVFGSAWILKRGMVLMAAKYDPKTVNYSLGQAMGLASLWLGKLVAITAVFYFATAAGYSVNYIGGFLPIGVVVGVFLFRWTSSTEDQ